MSRTVQLLMQLAYGKDPERTLQGMQYRGKPRL
jgi:hypothetical protein